MPHGNYGKLNWAPKHPGLCIILPQAGAWADRARVFETIAIVTLKSRKYLGSTVGILLRLMSYFSIFKAADNSGE